MTTPASLSFSSDLLPVLPLADTNQKPEEREFLDVIHKGQPPREQFTVEENGSWISSEASGKYQMQWKEVPQRKLTILPKFNNSLIRESTYIIFLYGTNPDQWKVNTEKLYGMVTLSN